MTRKSTAADLPGMENRAIKPLEDIAASYADVRDRRIALNTEEADLKKTALALMHKYGKIKPLEDIAASYADVRDRRIALNTEEADLKKTALALMHKYGKTVYKHDGIEIHIVTGEENVKVKIHKDADNAEDDAEG